ncbi:MAG TPA: anhydro-N-acetylmuramic acid kinase [Rhodocyclaceae bacterium]
MEHYIGLMSGTSLDGVDAVLVGFSAAGPAPQGAIHHAFPAELRDQALALCTAGSDEIHRAAMLGNALAEHYAEAVGQLLEATGMAPAEIAAIGCHGQTLRHRPEAGYTVQIGNSALLAERSGITVVSDFRSRDIAAGGQGAPLVPAVHEALFRQPNRHRVILNLGGIANLTNLAPGQPVTGFDCGPANMLLDAWASRYLGRAYDQDGRWAANGTISESLLHTLLTHPFLAEAPPKSCGREQFGIAWLDGLLAGPESPADVQAPLVAFTGHSAAEAIQAWCGSPEELYVCGGGARNPLVMATLQRELPATAVATTDTLGLPAEQVEAFAFAWLARQCLLRQPGNLPSVTGAAGPRVLGAIHPA